MNKNQKNEQIERIMAYEEKLDRCNDRLKELSAAWEAYKAVQGELFELKEYYTGALWRKDFEDDEAGKIPQDLKRGVLSEDAVDSLLDQAAELMEELRNASVEEKAEQE